MFEPKGYVTLSLYVALAALAIGCGLHALMNKRDPRSAAGWIALCLFAPAIGAFCYLLLGVNRASRRAAKLAGQPTDRLSRHYRLFSDDPLGMVPPSTDGNEIEPMFDGPAAYAAMLERIAKARHTVLLSQYIFEARGIGQEFIGALTAAAGRGVAVYVILDRVGALYSMGSTRRRLARGGVNVAMFLPPLFKPFAWHLNLRNHRKILVIDDAEAYTGGMNIRNGYVPAADAAEPTICDAHFRCRGPVVSALATVFREDWQYATGSALAPTNGDSPATGRTRCRMTIDGPDNDVDLLTVTLLGAITRARQHVRIMMPYFLPPQELITGLQTAAIRGVRVDIVVPQKNNLPFVHWAMLHMFKQLLRYRIRVHFQTGPFNHSKLVTVDGSCAIFGSVNADYRSLRLNFELAIEAWDAAFCADINRYIDARINAAEALTLDSLRALPAWKKFRNAVVWLGAPYL